MERLLPPGGVSTVGRLLNWTAAARGRTFGLIILSLAATAVVDYSTGHRYMFSPLYLFPVLLATTTYGRRIGTVVAAMAAVAWTLSQQVRGAPVFPWGPFAWNALMHFAVLSAVGWLLAALEAEMVSARHDYLTRLFNRRHFAQSLAAERSRSARTGEPFSVLSIDLDRFKRLNDTLGHAAGDEALKAVAALLSASARAMDLSARMGGDEFCMLLPGADAAVADSVARRLQAAATEEFRRRGWPLGMSIGIATTRGDAETADALLRRADEAMYLQKRARRNGPMIAEVER